MLAGKMLISKVQKIHFSLKVVHNIYKTTYDELLSINNGVSIHTRYLRFLVTEVVKSVNNLNPQYMWDYVKMNLVSNLNLQFIWDYFKVNFFLYNLKKGNTLSLPAAHSSRH